MYVYLSTRILATQLLQLTFDVTMQMEQEVEETKRKKEHHFTKSVTPDISDEHEESDGYLSDGEGSDLSARAEEIADRVLAADKQSEIHHCTCIISYM